MTAGIEDQKRLVPKVMPKCDAGLQIAATCPTCREYADPAHLVEWPGGRLALSCKRCCVACHPPVEQWAAEPVTITGVQVGLF